MKKSVLALLLALCLAVSGIAAFAEDMGPMTADELAAWADSLKTQALETAPENDPKEEGEVPGGYLFVYPFAEIYADRAEMTAETHLSAVVMSDTEDVSFRGLALTMTPWDVVALFPNNNPELAGTREGALLYLQESEDGAMRYGRIFRDGQRVSAIEYGCLIPAGDEYYATKLTCAFTDSLLSEIRAEGFDPAAAPQVSEVEREQLAFDLNALASETEYRAVKSSRDGLELTPFGTEDLVFSGLDFLELQPADLPGTPETETIDNEDGTELLWVEGDGYSAVFVSGADGDTTQIVSLSIEDDALEGPRCVRLGDMFHEDLQRFRFENRETEGDTEVLYGSENEVPRGIAEYDADGITLRYVTATPDGREVELLLRYTLSRLSEMILYVR